MDGFKTIRFKVRTADRFKHFSKKISSSYSETLDRIMNFFEWHGFLPTDQFEKKIMKEILKNRKRTDDTIAIIRNIEKNNDKPNTAMLQLLFEGSTEEEEELQKMVDEIYDNSSLDAPTGEIPALTKWEYDELQKKLLETKKEVIGFIDKIKPVKNRFGRDYFKLEIYNQELIKFKRYINRL